VNVKLTIMGSQLESFYGTWWFIVGHVILVSILFCLLLGWRLNRLNSMRQLDRAINAQTDKLREQLSLLEISHQRLTRETYLHQRLSASISHDVKTPLNFAVLALTKIQQQLQEEKHPLAEAIQSIQTSTYEIQQYTEMLADYSRILLTGEDIAAQSIKLRDLINEKIQLFDKIAAQKGISFANNIRAKNKINGNRQLLNIVLHNLIDNAIKFTLEGQISFESAVLDDIIEINIRDTGVGMNHVQVARINLYNQKSRDNYVNGSPTHGLGLKIVKDLINLMNGTLYIKSAPRVGTIVTLRLPLEHLSP
jgi:signal transduction histidine kinase